MQSGWVLSVDFGTSNTAAADQDMASGAIRVVALSHGGHLMPSSVYVESPAVIDVGEVALNKAPTMPAHFVPAPKRLLTLGQSSFQVGQSMVPGQAVVAAVLRAVLARAEAQHAGRRPDGLVLTHPENWSPQQIQILIDAGNGLGYPVRTVSEPRAAAHYYARVARVTPGDRVAVFDFGGGTLDVAVLTAQPDGAFAVVAAQGDNACGGRNFDAAIRRWVDGQLADSNPALLTYLHEAASVGELRALDDSIRRAKEVLSEAAQATIEISAGGQYAVLSLTRTEFEGLIGRDIARAVELTRATLHAAGAGNSLKVIYLTGGSSRIPLVHQRVQELGPIATLDDPKTVVAQGALVAPITVQANAVAAVPAPVPTAAPSQPRRKRRVLPAVAVATLVIAVGAGGAVWFVMRDSTSAVAAARDAGLDGARQAAVNLNSMNPNDIDGSLQRMQSSMTGQMLATFTTDEQKVKQTAQDSHTAITSTVQGAAITQLNSGLDKASALVVLQQISTPSGQAPTTQQVSWSLDMAKTGQGWKVEQAKSLGTAAASTPPPQLQASLPSDNQAFVDAATTNAVKAAAVHDLTVLSQYDYGHLDGFRATVDSVVTGQLLTAFDQNADTLVSNIQQAKALTTAKIDPVGVMAVHSDHADVLVYLTTDMTKSGVAQGSSASPMALKLTKVNGQWLLSAVNGTK